MRSGFDYAVPDDWPEPEVGARVSVSFGRGASAREIIGIVTDVNPTNVHDKLKPATRLLDRPALLPEELVNLARWLSAYYHHPLGEVFATLLPSVLRRDAEVPEARGSRRWVIATPDADLSRADVQRQAFEWLTQRSSASDDELRQAGITSATVRALAERGAIEATAAAAVQQSLEVPPEPTDEQAAALSQIDVTRGFGCTLIDGVTGSGKTELYLRLIEQALSQGRQVLVLVPEISLTPQTVSRFSARFGAVDSQHSALSDGERARSWLRCQSGETRIVIGTRSAVFAPLPELGLIVVDEEHDGSFKQQDGLRYNARDVALVRARNLNIPVVLGSATPALESLANAKAGRYQHLTLTRRAGGAELPGLQVLDIRGHSLVGGLSPELIRVMRSHLDNKGQVLVFINRRGFAPALMCTDCRWLAACESCDAKLTLHRQPAHLRCHHCGHGEAVPVTCPACGNMELTSVGTGTQRSEEELGARFPDVPLIRIDRDSTRSKARLEAHLDTINKGEPMILVGTQMLAKGHHFPDVTLVVVLGIDGALTSVDFRAPERIAALLTQVAGRAGRAERPGSVWIQTLQPEHSLFACLAKEGYSGFAQLELAQRHAAGLPPEVPLAIVRAESRNPTAGAELLSTLSDFAGVTRLGPAPAPMHRRDERFRWQVLLLAPERRALHAALAAHVKTLGKEASRQVRWSVDVDPFDTL